MEWIIGMILLAFYVIGPIISFGIFLLIAFFAIKLLGGIFGGGSYGSSSMSGSSSFPSKGGNAPSGIRELDELNRIRREQSDTFQAGLKSDAAQAGIFLDD